MKRVIAILLIAAVLLGCTACAGSTVGAAGMDLIERPLHGEEPQVPSHPGESGSVPDSEEGASVPKEPDVQEPAEDGTDVPEEVPSTEPPQEPDEPYIRSIDPAKPMVALTFDDGPHAVYTDQILDILEENHAVATFFEVGRNVANCPGPLSRMAELGCEIGSHSNAHKDLSKLKASALEKDLETADEAFIKAVGFAPTLLRPPYGAVNKTVKHGTGRTVITWTVDTEDWMSQDADKVVSYMQSLPDLDGEIVLLHSIYESTVEAVRVLIPWLIEEGYQLVTVSELMAYYYGELLEPGEFFGYTYFTSHGRTDTPAVLPGDASGGEGTEDEASDTTPAGGESQPPAGEGEAAEPPAGQEEQPGQPGGGVAPDAPGSAAAPDETVTLGGSGEGSVRPEKPVIPGHPPVEEGKPGIPSGDARDAGGENGPIGDTADQPSSM